MTIQEAGPVRPDNSLRATLAADEWDIFISYSRKDHAFATRLHAFLNAYQPPRDLPLPQRRLQAFLDTSDFVASDYRPAIRRHLKNASKLLVICSPNATASRFVGPEIDDFIALRPTPVPAADGAARSDIVSVIIDGLPANEVADPADPRCAFPAALCRALAMPIAIDYRDFDPRHNKLGEGKYHDAWFTLLAALYGYDRATIEERERKRRVRQLRIRAAIAGAVAVGLAGLSVWALNERSDAIGQRTHAYARQLTAQAQVELADVRKPAAPAVTQALASLSLEPTEEASAALKTGIQRLPPLPLGQLPLAKEDGVPTSLTFSSDSKFLLGISDKAVQLWQLSDRTLLVRHPIEGTAAFVAFSPDNGAAVVSIRAKEGADATRAVRLDSRTRTASEANYARILDTAQDANGVRALVAATSDGKLQVVDLVSDKVERELPLARAAKLAKFDAKSGGILMVDSANEVSIIAADSERQTKKARLPAAGMPLAFGSHAGLLAVSDHAARKLAIIQIDTDKTLMEVAEDEGDRFIDFIGNDGLFRLSTMHGVDVYNIGLQRLLLTVEYGQAIVVDPKAMSEVARQMPVVDAAVARDGTLFVTALKDGRVTVWQAGLRSAYGVSGAMPVAELAPVAQFDHGDTLGASTRWVALPVLFASPDGRYIASQSDGLRTNTLGGISLANPMVRIWDVYRGGEIGRFQSPGGMVVAFPASGDIVATVRAGGANAREARLDLWQLSTDRAVDRSSQNIDLPGQGPIAASADGRLTAWLDPDGSLRLRRRDSNAVAVIDNVRDAAQRAFAASIADREQRLASLDEQAREMLSRMPPLLDPFSQHDAWQEQSRQGGTQIPGGLPAIGSVVIAGNGCCVAVLVGPMLRLYGLDDHRLIAERIFTDMLPIPAMPYLMPTANLLLSHDGAAYAVALDSWESFKATMAGRAKQGGTSGPPPPAWRRELRIFTREGTQPTGVVELLFAQTPALALPLTWPLAVDSQGRHIALQQIDDIRGPSRNVVVLQLPGGAAALKIPGEDWTYDPFDAASTIVLMARRAAFSADDGRLVIAGTQPACPMVDKMTPAMMRAKVPMCTQLSTEVEVWDLASGRRVTETAFTFTPDGAVADTTPASVLPTLPTLANRQVLALDFLDDKTISLATLDGSPSAEPRAMKLTVERVQLDDRSLADQACRRLPEEARAIRPEDWQRDLPGERYRPLCQ